ncbi:MAG: LytTR family transcriptional regulator DNA-binding domain-containing protein, partial [Bacteroidales bacterium]|nr:LytTR family transcriptional regulator DNA-binding domain-containing protein [Bacteroidales bacterium]
RACELIKEGRESMNSDIRSLREDFMEFVNRNYKKRFVIKIGNRFEIINTGEIAYFYSEEKTTHLMTVNNEKYALDSPLNIIAEVVDPSKFFQISRSLIVSVNAITSVSKLGSSGKLSVKVKPEYEGDAICSRMRSSDFLHWLDDMS